MLYDFECSEGHIYEVRCSYEDRVQKEHPCPFCGHLGKYIIQQVPALLTTIIPTYPGSKAVSAGFQHSHGPKPGTKLMSGPGGMTRPKEFDSKISEMYQPDPAASVKRALKNAGNN